MADIARGAAEAAGDVQKQTYVVFVSTDVKHDTGPVLTQWLHNFDAGQPGALRRAARHAGAGRRRAGGLAHLAGRGRRADPLDPGAALRSRRLRADVVRLQRQRRAAADRPRPPARGWIGSALVTWTSCCGRGWAPSPGWSSAWCGSGRRWRSWLAPRRSCRRCGPTTRRRSGCRRRSGTACPCSSSALGILLVVGDHRADRRGGLGAAAAGVPDRAHPGRGARHPARVRLLRRRRARPTPARPTRWTSCATSGCWSSRCSS